MPLASVAGLIGPALAQGGGLCRRSEREARRAAEGMVGCCISAEDQGTAARVAATFTQGRTFVAHAGPVPIARQATGTAIAGRMRSG